MQPVCTSDPNLWTSTSILDHNEARKGCADCPKVQACIAQALAIAGESTSPITRGPDGTWGGLLWIDGSVVVRSGQAEAPQQEVA